MADIERQFPGFWREDRHLSFFLAFLVLMTIFVPMVGESRPGRIAIDLTFAIMLLSGAIATVHKRILIYLIIALTILEFTADLIAEFNPSFSTAQPVCLSASRTKRRRSDSTMNLRKRKIHRVSFHCWGWTARPFPRCLAVVGEAFVLTSPFIERDYRNMAEMVGRRSQTA